MLVGRPNRPLGTWPLGRIVSSSWTRWDGPNSHSAYLIRRVQETNHKTMFLRGRGDLGLETVNRIAFVSRLGAGMCLRFQFFLIDMIT